MKTKFRPFENESQYLTIGDLEFENRVDMIEIHGSLALTCDREGLESARKLSALVQSIVQEMEARGRAGSLPAKIEFNKPKEIKNPFD